MSRATGRHIRPKKLNAKQNVQIFREDQVDQIIEFDASRTAIETGVEKAEESEYHLQQAIKASQAAKADAKFKDAYIPTPPTIASDVKYDVLYPKGHQQPATYIRSSATVEDCSGVAYCMDEEDEIALKQINARLPQGIEPCSEDHFEEVMNFFEETTQAKQPYANVGNAPVLTLPELEEHYDDTVPASVPRYSKYIYEHWKNRRTAVSNHSLEPHLKFETGQETDDADPYVCFRRRELRQIRKTRNRDAQSADKLRKLRLELETARNLLLMVKKREQMRKEVLEIDRLVFEQRLQFRDTKRKLGRAGDEDLLINQKKQRLPPTTSPGQHLLPSQVRMPVGSGASDLRTLEDVRADRQKNVDNEIQVNIEKHIRWNEGWVDKTRAPLTPEAEVSFAQQEGAFREAMAATEYLPTPPASISDEESTQPQEVMDAEPQKDPTSSTPFRYASPADEGTDMPMPSFRRRTGRGGRQWIDRKFPIRSKRDRDDDRFKFDSDGEDVDMVDAVEEDPIWTRMSQRAYLLGTGRPHESQVPSRRATIEPGSSTNHSSPQVPVAQQTTAAS